MAQVELNRGESFVSEAGCFVSMNGGFTVNTSTHQRGSGGVLKALRRVFAGSSFFLNHFTSQQDGASLWLAPTLPGDLLVQDLKSERIILSAYCFVGAGAGVDLDLSWQGLKSVLSGENLFWMEAKGTGPIVISSFGAIVERELKGEEYIVDTGHIVGFSETLNFSISKAGHSWFHSFLGGEGFVCRFKGRGKLWLQSHNPTQFGQTIGPDLNPR